MEQIELKLEQVKSELKNLKPKKNQNIVWKSFPYNKNNLKIIKMVVSSLSTKNNDFRVTYDENIIFVERDVWS